MLTLRGLAALAAMALGLAACGDGTGPAPLPTVDCTDASVQVLAVGEHTIINPNVVGSCIRVPAAGAGGAEYLYVALATDGTVTENGVKTPYALQGGAAGAALDLASPLPSPVLKAFRPPMSAAMFHHQLREQERVLAMTPTVGLRSGGPQFAAAAVVPPTVGHQRNFFVCADQECLANEMVQTSGTAQYVGSKVAIYVDDGAPIGGYTQSDLNNVGALFDDHLYPIGTAAFGSESDIDNNGVVVVLLTQYVNRLSDDCDQSVVLGYFFGLDLRPGQTGSNAGEIFYGLVPDPAGLAHPGCDISTNYANTNIPPTFIHEFQHMISFHQHGNSLQEETWLNEGLSHFAEELAGRKIPDPACVNNDCLTQFAGANLVNTYNYLTDPEAEYLIAPGSSFGSLEERGAGWLFVRWLADHFGTDPDGTNVTRNLVGTSRRGATNVEFVTGESFSTLISQWQMANYLDNLSGFVPGNARLAYPSWNLRAVFQSFNSQNPSKFPTVYPLVPDQVTPSGYTRAGTLRAGSGRHLRIVQPASGAAVDVQLTSSDGQSVPVASVKPRIALVRIR